MGMFDSFHIHFKNSYLEIQTKVFSSVLKVFQLGEQFGEIDEEKLQWYQEFGKKKKKYTKNIIKKGKFVFYLDCCSDNFKHFEDPPDFRFIAISYQGIWLDYSICRIEREKEAINSLFSIWNDFNYYQHGTSRIFQKLEKENSKFIRFFSTITSLSWSLENKNKLKLVEEKPIYEKIESFCNKLLNERIKPPLEENMLQSIRTKKIIGDLPLKTLQYSYVFCDQSVLLLKQKMDIKVLEYLIDELGIPEDLLFCLPKIKINSQKIAYNIQYAYPKLKNKIMATCSWVDLFNYSLQFKNEKFCLELLEKDPKLVGQIDINLEKKYWGKIIEVIINNIELVPKENIKKLLDYVNLHEKKSRTEKVKWQVIAQHKKTLSAYFQSMLLKEQVENKISNTNLQKIL